MRYSISPDKLIDWLDRKIRQGYSIYKLAKVMGLSHVTIYKWKEKRIKSIEGKSISRIAFVDKCDLGEVLLMLDAQVLHD
ncbi:MAG: helix-turn-helix domain-containing protein [Planktothrix sp.]